MGKDWPINVLTWTIWAYWGTVLLLVFYKRLRHGQRAGVIPRHGWEKRLWLGVIPVFLAWNTFPALAGWLSEGPFSLPDWASGVPAIQAVRGAAAVLAVACFLATLSCWLLMGRNWSMAIVPGQKTELITGGLFGWVRHPIYSLSILMMICSAVTVATLPMFLVAILHIGLLNFKATKEEEHMTQRHETAYTRYCQSVGRFVPRLRSVAGERAGSMH